MKTGLLLLVCLCLCFVFSGCLKSKVEMLVTGEPATFTMTKKPSQGAIHRLEMELIANLDGQARIQLVEEGKVLRETQLEGTSRFDYRGDFYANEAEIRYIPSTATKGRLQVRYDFKD